MLEALSVSSLNDYLKCPALYYFRKRTTLTAERYESDAMRLGTLVHAGLAAALRVDVDHGAAARTALSPDDPLTEQAVTILDYAIPALGVGTRFTAYRLNGAPVVEYGFDLVYGGRVRLHGTIDAVVQHADGRVLCVDWKTRGQMMNADAVALDKQLYVYADACQRLGIALDGILQVQINTAPPADLQTLKGKDGTAAAHYSRSVGKTTTARFNAAVAHLPPAERSAAALLFHDKVVPETEFIRVTPIPMSGVTPTMRVVLAQVLALYGDETFLPVLSSDICKTCAWRGPCKARTMGG